jgi:hypothetical protein
MVDALCPLVQRVFNCSMRSSVQVMMLSRSEKPALAARAGVTEKLPLQAELRRGQSELLLSGAGSAAANGSAALSGRLTIPAKRSRFLRAPLFRLSSRSGRECGCACWWPGFFW